ncbi:MAG: redox-sensing transcriptional repressor Rex [Desulfobulbaceae bacterium]|nr:redox-sensing transcriptional repressor Rex [Candidatus Kapabacteria bacterium]MBS4000496.1 redox-sensing transcriptional repressor Rex [Desulfobulbaceae bacterium]
MTNKGQILRLLNYKNLLKHLQTLGFKKVFSDNISDTLEISSSLVRKDFGNFGITGNRKGGYEIDSILGKIDDILGKDEIQKVVVIGVGRIGEALMKYQGFMKEGIQIVAGFDIDPSRINTEGNPPVLHNDKIADFIKENDIKICIMTVPQMVAKHTVDLLSATGIGGILNFTPIKFQSTAELTINNINIVHELENLIYVVNKQKDKE